MRIHRSIFSVLTTLLTVSTILVAQAQERCGTAKHTHQLRMQGLQERQDRFENWINQQVSFRRSLRTKAAKYVIPVVVHVLHNGEAVGTGTNISDAQILSQIKVLNNDFQRKNADAANTPADFATVAGSMDIEFVLAKRDPDGKATSGIVRVKGAKASWTSNDNYQLKSQSYWPSEDYLNIWVCDLRDYLGYSQFPVSNLPGLEDSSNNPLTDGVVISYEVFGSIDDGNFNLDPDYNKGRTTTHEVSHFFGLNHIWGDDGNECTGTDYVNDTPNQAGYTSGCPSHPRTTCSPAVVSMFMNFLDYTDDACMNMFTKGQMERMQVVIENSPRRASLLTSKGAELPDPLDNDLGLRAVTSPALSQCDQSITPVIEVQNYGRNTITSTTIRFRVNGNLVETKNVSLNLTAQSSTKITFNTVSLATGTSTISFDIISTNGTPDADAIGNANTISSTVYVPASINLPFTETFSSVPNDWIIQNPDQQITWKSTTAPNQRTDNDALVLEFFNYKDKFGEVDILLTPVFSLKDAGAAVLYFDIAHARFDESNDELRVVLIKNCTSIDEGTIIYENSGNDTLATVSPTRSYFKPNSPDDWRTEFVRLTPYGGAEFVQLAFVGVNAYGNNLYLDNITVATSGSHDVSLTQVQRPALVTADASPEPVIEVQNTGTETITNLTVDIGLNGGNTSSKVYNNLFIEPGQISVLTLPEITINTGENTLEVALRNPNGVADINPENNTRSIKIVLNQETDRIPLRQTFDTASGAAWTIANPVTGKNWELTSTNYGKSLYYNAYNNSVIGDESWFVTPVLDFSNALKASMQFDISYKQQGDRQEEFQIFVSTDGGNSYNPINFTLPEVLSSNTGWKPQSEDDWFNDLSVDLSQYAREEDVRIAFVITNANGNNFYLDNIEFFVSETPPDVNIEPPYSIFGYNLDDFSTSSVQIGFNLPERQKVKAQIVDVTGKIITSMQWEDVLNQVYDLSSNLDVSFGVYIVRLQIGDRFYADRIIIGR